MTRAQAARCALVAEMNAFARGYVLSSLPAVRDLSAPGTVLAVLD
ncbi:hypothetical protein AB0J20_09980 [Micromonospora costi]